MDWSLSLIDHCQKESDGWHSVGRDRGPVVNEILLIVIKGILPVMGGMLLVIGGLLHVIGALFHDMRPQMTLLICARVRRPINHNQRDRAEAPSI